MVEQKTKSHVLLTMIGTGNYNEVIYTIHEKQSKKTRFFCEALLHHLLEHDPIDRVVVLLTQGAAQGPAWKGNAQQQQKGLRQVLEELFSGRDITLITTEDDPIHDGTTEEQVWQIFQKIKEKIPNDSRLTLDITHGFRSLPLLMVITTAYLSYVPSRFIEIEAVYYGVIQEDTSQNEKVKQGQAINLRPILTLFEWVTAVDSFERSGTLNQISALITRENRSLWHKLGDSEQKGELPTNFKGIADSMKSLSQAIELGRLGEINKPIEELQSRLEKTKKEAERWLLPLTELLEQIPNTFMDLRTDENDIDSHLKAQFRLIQWYREKGYIVQAVLLLREWFITWFMSKSSRETQSSLENILSNSEKREEAAKELGKLEATVRQLAEHYSFKVKIIANIENELDIAEIWNNLTGLRNDVGHFGHRSAQLKATKIEEHLDNLLEKLKPLVQLN